MAEYRLFYRALLQKRPIIVRSLLIVVAISCLHSGGSLKLQVSIAEYRLFYRALLQKRPIILSSRCYLVPTFSTLLKTTGLYCRISSLLQSSFAKETYNCKGPTNRSHPISSAYI